MRDILIILTSSFPDTLDTGGKQAVFNMIDSIRNDYNISIIYNQKDISSDESKNQLKVKWNNVQFYEYSSSGKTIIDLKKQIDRVLYRFFFRDETDSLNRKLFNENLFSDEFITFINKVIGDNNFQLIQTEFYTGTELCYALPKSIKKVFVQHEIRYIRNALVLSENKAVNQFSNFLFEQSKANEIAAMNQYDAVITLTDVDKQKLVKDGVTTDIFVSPASLDSSNDSLEFKPATSQISFVGGENHTPNYDGILWFLDHIWQKVQAKNPKIRFNIVGKWSKKTKNLFYSKYKNIKFCGIVEDLSTVLNGTVVIIPLKVGSGMRMKALEAIKCKCSIVSTTIGVEGLPFRNEIDSYIVDNESDFAERVIKLLNNNSTQEKFWKNSNQWYQEHYSKNALCDIRKGIYDRLILTSK